MLCWKGFIELRSGGWVIGERLLAHSLHYEPISAVNLISLECPVRRTCACNASQNETSMEILIRQATVDEAPALAALQRHTALFAYASIFPPEAPQPDLDGMTLDWQQRLNGIHSPTLVVMWQMSAIAWPGSSSHVVIPAILSLDTSRGCTWIPSIGVMVSVGRSTSRL